MDLGHEAQEKTSPDAITGQVWIVLTTTVIGWIVTSLDLQLSAFLQPQITASLKVSATYVGNVFFIFSLGLAIGALLLGYFSDLWIGRRRAFMFSILGTIAFTGLSGLSQNAWEFAACRFCAGIFSGGEWILGLSILSEVAPQRHRSLLLGATQAGVGAGYGIANLFAATFAAPDAAGWRWAYIASFGFALVTYVVRLKVEESPHWKHAVGQGRRQRLTDVRENVGALFHGRQAYLTMLAVGLFIAIGEPQGTWDFLYPKWFHGLGSQFSGYRITYAYELAIIASTLAGGWFMDRVSARWLMPVVWLSVPFTLLLWLGSSSNLLQEGGYLFLAGFGRQAAWAIVSGYFAVLFPTRLRGTGMGITWVGGWLLGYTLSAAWGPELQAFAGWGAWWIVQVVLLVVMPLPMLFAGIETRGKDLDFQEQSDEARNPASPTS